MLNFRSGFVFNTIYSDSSSSFWTSADVIHALFPLRCKGNPYYTINNLVGERLLLEEID